MCCLFYYVEKVSYGFLFLEKIGLEIVVGFGIVGWIVVVIVGVYIGVWCFWGKFVDFDDFCIGEVC